MWNILFVTIGGGLGALARYGVSRLVSSRTDSIFPWGTLVVNIAGAFLLALLYQIFERVFVSAEIRNLFTVGFAASFATFSVFSVELVTMLEAGHFGQAALYLGVSVVAGLAAAGLGIVVANIGLSMARY